MASTLATRDRQRARETEGGRGDHGAEPDRRRVAGEPGEGGPGVRWAWQPVLREDAQVVVGAEEGVEAELLGEAGDSEELVIAGALLGFGEDAELHGLGE